MNFKAELTAMKGRLFSPELYQAMGEASTQRRRERGLTWKDAIWRRAQAQLDPQLTPDQKDRLDQLRRQCQETGEYAAVVAFQNGLYTGFQQYFQRDTSDTPTKTSSTAPCCNTPAPNGRPFSAPAWRTTRPRPMP